MKYITVNANSILVRIERGETVLENKFPIRRYDSLDEAIEAARSWRDKKHMEVFGIPVTSKKIVLRKNKERTPATDPRTGLELPALPPGLSYGFHRGRLLYVVVSFQVEKKPKRIRLSIGDRHLKDVIDDALKIRLDKIKKHGI